MREFAITYPQLMNQALGYRLSEADLVRLHEAHALAQKLVDGIYRKEGAPFLCHLIRTASIVMAETEARQMDVILASLLHAVYFLHYFESSSRRGPRKADRVFLRARIGDRAEDLVNRYGDLPWNDDRVLLGYVENVENHNVELRHLLLMKLANELEDHLDGAVAYAPNASAEPYVHFGSRYVELAEGLGHECLAAELREAFDQCRRTEVPETFVASHRRSYELTSRLWTANLVERMGSALRRARENA